MKYIFAALLTLSLFAACKEKKVKLKANGFIQGREVYGTPIKNSSVTDLDAITTAIQKADKADMKVRGKVAEVRKKNCFTMKLADGTIVCVKLKDSSVAIPATIAGKDIIMDGTVYSNIPETTTTATAINEVKSPIKATEELSFIASGLVVL